METYEELAAKFTRLFDNDPVFQSMKRGFILWGDIFMTKEEEQFHREWASANAIVSEDSSFSSATLSIKSEFAYESDSDSNSDSDKDPESSSDTISIIMPQNVVYDNTDNNWEVPSKTFKTEHIIIPVSSNTIKTLIVRNLPRDITLAELRPIFEAYGPVKDVYVPKNMDKSSPLYGTVKGFALIKYLSAQHSSYAYSILNGRLRIRKHFVSIEFAKEDR